MRRKRRLHRCWQTLRTRYHLTKPCLNASNKSMNGNMILFRAKIRNCWKRSTRTLSEKVRCCLMIKWHVWKRLTCASQTCSSSGVICYRMLPMMLWFGLTAKSSWLVLVRPISPNVPRMLRAVIRKHPMPSSSSTPPSRRCWPVLTTVTCAVRSMRRLFTVLMDQASTIPIR